MAQIVLTLTPAHLNRLVDAVAGTYSYSATIPDPNVEGGTLPNPESKAEFARRMIITDTRNMVRAWEKRVAIEAAVAPINPAPIDIT